MSKKQKRILIAGFEIGGQMQLLAETLRRKGFKATSVAFNKDFMNYKNDIKIPAKSFFRRFIFFLRAIKNYDVFHFFWGVSLVSFWRFHLIDLPILKFFKKKIVVHFRGLDIVDIVYFDYLRAITDGKKLPLPPMSRKDQLKKLKKWNKYANTVLVSEPDLFQLAKNAILSPQVIDLNYWQSEMKKASEKDNIIRIIHAPTSRRKKGTEYLEKAVQSLQQKGYSIELLLAERLEAHMIKSYYEKADIGVDQLLYGWHGKVSCELMAMKIPVVCYIRSDYKKYRPDLPIVNANPKTIEDVLEDLIKNKEKRKTIGEKSHDYVKKYHDVEKEADSLLKLYEN